MSNITNKMLDEKKEKAVEEKKKWISLTGLCNNNCIFCLDGNRTDKFHRSEEEIKKQILDGIKEGATRLVLSGGEPTIHPKILDFIKYGKQLGYKKVQIITNGRMLAYQSFVNALWNAGLNEVTFSIHGHTKELHESMTRVQGSFAQIVQGIKNAIEAGFIVNSDTTITKINYKYLQEILEFVHSLGINEVNLMSLVPFGRAWQHRDVVFYKFQEIMPFVHKVIDYCKENNIILWFSRFPAEYLEGYEEYIESYKKILEEVLARDEEFFKKPACYGERCRYCGIKSVCKNLVNGNYTKFTPPCLSFPEMNKSIEMVKKGNKPFRDFAIEVCKNARVKRLSCSKCIFNDSCEGILREHVRKDGFGIIKPIIQKEIRINLDCNQDCLFCNTDRNAENFILDDSKIIEQIRNWAKQGVNYLVITGKEPALHKNLGQFLRKAKELGYKKIELQTNALKFSDKTFLKNMKDAGLTHAFVSFHSHDKNMYNRITQSNTFEKALQGIKNLVDENIKVTINVVINELNYKKVAETVGFINEKFKEVEGIVLSFVAPICNALNNKEIIPKISNTVPYIKEAINECRRYNINCRIPSRCGIPICFMPSYKEHFDEVTEKTRWGNNEGKIKMDKCSECSFNNSCNGFWQEYVKIHGFK